MLSAEDNELLTRVTGDAPMGQMMRRYWVPACLAEEVAEPDGTPVRVRALGEQLVAFRDTAGNARRRRRALPAPPGVARARAQRRGRPALHLSRLEVRRRRHCIDMPTEPDDYGYHDRMKIAAIRCARPAAWSGRISGRPNRAAVPGIRLDEDAARISARRQGRRAHELPAGLEGAIDSAHSWFLHQGIISDWKKRAESRRTPRPSSKPKTPATVSATPRSASRRRPGHRSTCA